MLTADSSNKKETFKVAFLTAASIFIMGYLNGMALNTFDLGTMISAQSGNVIWLGLNAAGGYWIAFLENMGLLFGFMGGAAFALYTQSLFKDKVRQFFYNWTVFIAPIILYPLALQYIVPAVISYLVLGFASGAALGFFRKMYHQEINNAMATGSVRFLGLSMAKKDKSDFLIFFVCVFAFAAGAFLYGVLARADYSIVDGTRIGLGYVINDRLSFGLTAIDTPRMAVVQREASSNLARMVGLLVICVIPYFFVPKENKQA